MYSKRNPPSRVSGKNPAFQKDDYPTARQKKTQQDLINEGKKFKFSVFKKPYADNSTYQEMEYEATPAGRTGLNLPPFPIFNWDLNEPPTWKEDKENCWCEGCNFPGGVNTIPQRIECDSSCDEITFIFEVLSDRILIFDLSSPCNDWIESGAILPIPLPNSEDCTEVHYCFIQTFTVHLDCHVDSCKCESNSERIITLTVCGKPYPILLECCPACEDLTIVDEDGTPATDTILRNGSNDYKTTGLCSGDIKWSVTVDSGSQLGGSTISQAGVLTAGATTCGSLKVTATCESCGTSATQYVRVTDAGAGKWSWYERCGYSYYCNTGCTTQQYLYFGNERWDEKNHYVYAADSCTGVCSDSPCTAIIEPVVGDGCPLGQTKYCATSNWQKAKWVCP